MKIDTHSHSARNCYRLYRLSSIVIDLSNELLKDTFNLLPGLAAYTARGSGRIWM